MIKRINIPIYPIMLYLSNGETVQELFTYFKKKIKLTDEVKDDLTSLVKPKSNDAFVLQLSAGGEYLIWIGSYKGELGDIQKLIHEITHLCFAIFEFIGSEINNSSEEPICYLHDYIVGVCLKSLK